MIRIRPVDKTRFLEKVKESGSCWLWTGASRSNGYGNAWVGPRNNRKTISAHRLSWIIHHGPIQAGLYVCHTCDNRLCVNPDHLWLGTQSDNITDMYNKGRGDRTSKSRGQSKHNARFTDEQIRDVRRVFLEGRTRAEIARQYGVTWRTVDLIVKGETWREVKA